MSHVLDFTGITSLDIEPDRILEAAKGELESVVVVGYRKDGREYFASSIADSGTAAWLLSRAMRLLHETCDEMADS